jgi:hypothetical protein
MTRGWFVGWSGFVGVWWVVLAGSFADDETCSYICFTFGDMLGFLFIPAAIVWSLGLIVLHVALRLRARRPSRSQGDHPGARRHCARPEGFDREAGLRREG